MMISCDHETVTSVIMYGVQCRSQCLVASQLTDSKDRKNTNEKEKLVSTVNLEKVVKCMKALR